MNQDAPSDFSVPVFDAGLLEELLVMSEGDAAVLIEIVQQFKDDTVVLFESLDAAVRAGDFHRIADIAHTIKGSGATFGMVRLGALALRLETAAKGADIAEIAQLHGPVKQAYFDALHSLEAVLVQGL